MNKKVTKVFLAGILLSSLSFAGRETDGSAGREGEGNSNLVPVSLEQSTLNTSASLKIEGAEIMGAEI